MNAYTISPPPPPGKALSTIHQWKVTYLIPVHGHQNKEDTSRIYLLPKERDRGY